MADTLKMLLMENEYGRYLKDVVDGKYIEMLKELR